MKGIYLHVLATRTAKHPASRYRFVSKNYKKKQDQGDQFYSWILFADLLDFYFDFEDIYI